MFDESHIAVAVAAGVFGWAGGHRWAEFTVAWREMKGAKRKYRSARRRWWRGGLPS